MPLDTNISPYYDDYSEDKNFHKVLFKPGLAVQARELTQLQTILQNQVKRVGDYLFVDGDKVTGPKPSVNLDARTVRILDSDARGVPINLENYMNTFVTTSNSDVIGFVEFVYTKDNPDIGDSVSLVISLKRFNSANDGMFDQNTNLDFYRDFTDALNRTRPNFTATTVTDITKNAFCTTTEFSKEIFLTNPNNSIEIGDLLVHPRITKKIYVTEIRSTIEIVVNEAPGVIIGNDRITFVKAATCPTMIFTQDPAVFYRNGYFVRCTNQKIVPDKNTGFPSKVVGFLSEDQIITSNDDVSLLDPALESSNYFALGADRLKIDLTLTSVGLNEYFAPASTEKYTDDANAEVQVESLTTSRIIYNSEDFIPLIKFNKGEIEFVKELTVDSVLDSKLAERTYDESGSYTVDKFTMYPSDGFEDSENLIFSLSAGKAYVGGYQVKTVGPTELKIPKNTKTETITSYNVNTTQGNYYKITGVSGGLVKPQLAEAADMYLELHSVLNPAAANTRIGTIAFKSMEYDSYSGSNVVYKLFTHYYAAEPEVPVSWQAWSSKFNIPEADGRYIANVFYESGDELSTLVYRIGPVLYSGGSISPTSGTKFYGLFREPDNYGVAYWYREWVAAGKDIGSIAGKFVAAALDSGTADATRILSNNKAFLSVINNSPFFDGIINVNQVKSIVGVRNAFTSYASSATYNNPSFYARIAQDGLSANNIILFDKKPSDALLFPLNKEYVKTVQNISTEYFKVFENISFTGGVFTRTLSLPESFPLGDGNIPASTARLNIILLIKTGATANVGYGTWDFEKGSVTVSGDAATLSINMGDSSFNGTGDIGIRIENDNVVPRTKTLITNQLKFLQINVAEVGFSMGTADIIRFNGVYKLANVARYLGNWNPDATYNYNDIISRNGVVYTSQMVSSNVDVFSGNAWAPVLAEPGQNFVFDNGQRDSFYDHGTVKYVGPSSTIPGAVLVSHSYFTHTGDGPAVVQSYPADYYPYIPTYRSVIDAREYNLRDTIDFRPRRLDNTDQQIYAQAIFPVSTVNTEIDLTYYIGRRDRIYVTNNFQNFSSPYNKFYYESGAESIYPIEPEDNSDLSKLSLAVIDIPPFATSAFDVRIAYDDNRRFTMKDIARIEDLTIRLDKAVKLQSVEIASLRSVITNDNGDILLKSGILIDDFSNLDKADLASGFFNCAIDETEKECFPSFNAYYVDLQAVENSDIFSFNDIISKKYEEEIFISQLEGNAFLNVNPGAINDGKGRAISSKKNSFLVNLLLTGGAMLLQSIALKTIAAYIVAAKGGIAVGGLAGGLTSYAGVAAVQAAQSGNVLAVAWQATRTMGLNFLEAVKSIDGIVKLVTRQLTDLVNIAEAVYEFVVGGFEGVVNMFTGGSSGGSLGSGGFVGGGYGSVGAAGQTAGGITTLAGSGALISQGVSTITTTMANILNQSIAQTFGGLQTGIVLISQGIVTGAITVAVAVANAISVALTGTVLISSASLAAANAWILAQPQILVVVAAIVIVYVAIKIVQKVWKSVKKLFCDERMKENIRFIKKMDNGLNLYSFEYKNEYKDIAGRGTKYGYIASEVETLYPKAVTIESNGFKAVNYSLIGR